MTINCAFDQILKLVSSEVAYVLTHSGWSPSVGSAQQIAWCHPRLPFPAQL